MTFQILFYILYLYSLNVFMHKDLVCYSHGYTGVRCQFFLNIIIFLDPDIICHE